MRLYAFLAAAVAFLAPATEAYIHTLGFPSTIEPGVPFEVYYEQLISQPRVHNLIFGIKKDNGFLSKSEIGSDLFLSAYIKGTVESTLSYCVLNFDLAHDLLRTSTLKLTDLLAADVLPGGAFNGTLSAKLTIPENFEKGPAIVKVLITEFSGLFNGAGFRAILVPVTVGDTTSTERSFGSIDDENAVSWVVADSA